MSILFERVFLLRRKEGSKEVSSKEICCNKKVLKGVAEEKIRHLLNEAVGVIVRLGLFLH